MFDTDSGLSAEAIQNASSECWQKLREELPLSIANLEPNQTDLKSNFLPPEGCIDPRTAF